MSRVGSRLGLVALSAFLAADVALVGLALRSTAGASDAGGRSTSAGGSAAPAGAATPSGTNTPSATESPAPDGAGPGLDVVPVTVGIVAVDAENAWRFETGSCSKGGSTLAITEDGGSTWQPRAAPFDATMRVRVRDNGAAFAIGSDKDCSPRFRQTEKGVPAWGAESRVPDAWFRDPKSSAAVGTAEGRKAEPCGEATVVDLSITDTAATALCSDGRVLSSDTGASWAPGATAPGSVAVAATDQRTLLVRPMDGCDGLGVVDAQAGDTALGCAEVDLAGVEPGRVALSVRGDQAWLLAGDTVLRSSGDLSEWATVG
jgi:hypothetical protein